MDTKRRLLSVVALMMVGGVLALPGVAHATGTISGQVYYDPPSGPNVPIAGVQVELRTSSDAPVGNPKTTDNNGNYSFTAFANGSFAYKVRLHPPVPYEAITPAAGETTVTPSDGATTTANFSVRGSTLGGFVYQDLDGDGTKSPNEPYLEGATVSVTGPATATATTAANGGYTTGQPILPAGSYTVTATKAGYTATTPDRTAAPAAGANALVAFIGLRYVTGTVTGDVYAETNGTPGRQAAEPPIPNAPVSVSGSYDGQSFTLNTTAGADGTYSLAVPAGSNRTVSAAQPAAYLDGPEFTTDANATTGADQFTNVTVTGGASTVPFQFGETGASISGITFSDRDADGTFDPAEPPTGMRMIAVAATGFAGTVTSAADGTFTVAGLPGGVDVTLTPGAVADAVAPAARILHPQVGATLVNTFLGYRFGDVQGTLIDRTTSMPVAGVAVALGGDASRTTVSAQDGTFSFPELAPGTYALHATAPAGDQLDTNVAGGPGGTVDATGITAIGIGQGQIGTGYELGLKSPAGASPTPTATATATVSPTASPTPTPTATPDAPVSATSVMIVAGKRIKVRRSRLRLGCQLDRGAVATCAFTIRDRKGRMLARGSVKATRVLALQTARLRLTARGKRALKRHPKRLRGTATVTAVDATGVALTATRPVRLRRA